MINPTPKHSRMLRLLAIPLLAGWTLLGAAHPHHPRHPHPHPHSQVHPHPHGHGQVHPHPRKRVPKAAPEPAPLKEADALINGKAIAPFLESLQRLDSAAPHRPAKSVVRVLQFGDSHTAADFWSGRVRRRLQDRFGNGGPGCLLPGKPWRGYPHADVHFVNGQGWPAQSLRNPACDGWVGLTGASLAPAPGEDFKLQAAFGEFRVSLLGPGEDALSASWEPLAGDATPAPLPLPLPRPVPLLSSEKLWTGKSLETFAVTGQPNQPRELSLTLPPGCSLLGIELLSGQPGVVYDELGLNGAELTDLERWNPDLRRSLLARAKPDLIVLAYGTNDLGMSPSLRPEYEHRIRTLLLALKEESGAAILLVGPLDRLGTKKRSRAALKAGATWIIQALTQASLDTGCAFWDARRAMGGLGSILKWRRAGLAQADLVHLNGPGYQRLGDQMADALLKGLTKADR